MLQYPLHRQYHRQQHLLRFLRRQRQLRQLKLPFLLQKFRPLRLMPQLRLLKYQRLLFKPRLRRLKRPLLQSFQKPRLKANSIEPVLLSCAKGPVKSEVEFVLEYRSLQADVVELVDTLS